MTTPEQMYAQSLEEIKDSVLAFGNKRTMLVQGDMGTGKSSLLHMLADELPEHTPCYFDCTTKDLGDIMIPNIVNADTDQSFVRFATNEELGAHLKKPIALMIDEYGKANTPVKNSLLRIMLERKIGPYELHPDSVVFATTNLGAEGVGDLLLPHQRNRISVVTSRKPTNMEWIEWGLSNDVEHTVLGWAKDTPQLFQSFTEVSNPEDNPYIFHPKAADRPAFVTPRSLEAASDILKVRDSLSSNAVTSNLIGTIGARGAMDLMAYVSLADQMPTLDDIKTSPKTAKIPESAAGVCMVVFRTLGAIEKDWINQWMDYLLRLDTEAQGMFANGVRAKKYQKQSLVMTNKKFTDWAMANNFLFAADKK